MRVPRMGARAMMPPIALKSGGGAGACGRAGAAEADGGGPERREEGGGAAHCVASGGGADEPDFCWSARLCSGKGSRGEKVRGRGAPETAGRESKRERRCVGQIMMIGRVFADADAADEEGEEGATACGVRVLTPPMM